MKILIVASWFPTPGSPVNGIFVAEQASALAVRHDVTVLAPAATDRGPTRRIELVGGYRLVRTGIPAGNCVHTLRYIREVIRELREGGYDLVHAHVTLPGGLAAVAAGLIAGRPSVITEHMGPFSNLLRSRRDRLKVRFALNHATAVIAVSSGLRAQMQAQRIARPVLVVPNLVDPGKFRCGKNVRMPGRYNILFVGRLNDRQKNLAVLLQAMSRLEDVGDSHYHLRIIGDGALRAEYECVAKDLGIDARCEFAGFQSPQQVAAALAGCNVFVLPSAYENCPVVVAEALACGRPVIVTRCGGSEEMVTDEYGAVVPVDDPAALCDAIRGMCRNLGAYEPEKISAYAQSRFGTDVVVNRLTGIYESILRDATDQQRAVGMRIAS